MSTGERRHGDRHEGLRDDLAAYALGALGAEEAAALERHLEDCESCRGRLRWLAPAIDVLPASVPQQAPPERLRERLMKTVRAEAAEQGAAAAPRHMPVAGESDPWWRRVRVATLRPAAGLAAVILVAAGVTAGYLLRGSDAPSRTLVEAEPVGGQAGASATLERRDGAATLHVEELPELGADEVYEIWVQRAGVMEPRNVFVLRHDGSAEASVPGTLESAEAVLVTREPRPGSTRPTSAPVLEAPLE